mmetsp:Transcript_14221/g.22151  ORF Transcript_14221/g.22151 Transcript_14221/m.22151 type:complete len:98 (+) Transcript_14221:96-389(+)
MSSQNQGPEGAHAGADFNNISRISEHNETTMMELENSQRGEKREDHKSEEIDQILKNTIKQASSNHNKSNHMELDSPFDAGFMVGGVVVASATKDSA